ncbi:acyltransferase domain-containing protein, partial [Nocardia nepalensis]|uniref:acyltransferase domain-containing protein n=1 Tax=Nocardia nepalensis TaxID=3375448 RepID=UPI003B682B48
MAAVNGVSSVVVSGDPDACEELIAHCETHAVRARRIEVDYASHSAQVETIREPLIDALDGLQPRAGSIAFYSTVTGGLFDTAGLDTRYWFDNAREPVLFAQATQSLIGAGFTTFIECSPHPLLALAMEDTAAGLETAVTVTGSLRRDEGGLDRFWKSVGHAYVTGAPLDWTKVYTTAPRRVALPTYAFQRQRYWLASTGLGGADVASAGLVGAEHPLLGAVVQQPESGAVALTGRLSLTTQPWLADHAVAGVVLFPGSGFVELALRAGDEVGATTIQELTLLAPLVFTEDRSVQVQVLVSTRDDSAISSRDESAVSGRGDSAGWSVSVYTRDTQTDTDWTLHAEGVLTTQQPTPSISQPTPSASSASVVDLAQWPPAGAEPVQVSGVYDWLTRHGYQYGPAFQGLQSAWRHGADVYAEVAVPEELDVTGMGIHPALLDTALHAAWAAAYTGASIDDLELRLPFSWGDVRLDAVGATRLRVHLSSSDNGALAVRLADTSGMPVLTGTVNTRPVTTEQLHTALHTTTTPGTGLLELTWTPLTTLPDSTPSPTRLWTPHNTTETDSADTDTADTDAADAGVVVWELSSGVEDVVGSVYAAT